MCDPIKSIANRLRGLREVLELSAQEVAESCHLRVEEYMALESGAPVVPVYVTRNRTPFCPVDVYFGAPYKIEDISQSDHAACHAAADAMLETIYKLGGDGHADLSGKDSGLLLRG